MRCTALAAANGAASTAAVAASPKARPPAQQRQREDRPRCERLLRHSRARTASRRSEPRRCPQSWAPSRSGSARCTARTSSRARGGGGGAACEDCSGPGGGRRPLARLVSHRAVSGTVARTPRQGAAGFVTPWSTRLSSNSVLFCRAAVQRMRWSVVKFDAAVLNYTSESS